MASTISTRIRRAWPEPYLLECLTPKDSLVALINWTVTPFPVDSDIPGPVVNALSDLLVARGSAAFHWPDAPTWPADQAIVFEPLPRSLWDGVLRPFREAWPMRLVVTRSTSVVRCVFDHVWAAVGTPVMLLRPGCRIDAALQAEFAARRDWRSFRFGASAYALLAPAVEGSAALLAAGTEADLTALLTEVRLAFVRAGVEVEG